MFSEQMNIEDCFPENFANNGVGEIIERQSLKYTSGMRYTFIHYCCSEVMMFQKRISCSVTWLYPSRSVQTC